MPDSRVLAAIVAVGLASYAMRAGGFLAAGAIPPRGLLERLLRLAPGNLFVAFAAAGILEGGWPSLVIPAGRGAASGLPVALAFDGVRGGERGLLALGAAMQPLIDPAFAKAA